MGFSLVVLAAGLGSRYGGFKQIDPVGPNGEILLDYSVFDAVRAGATQLVFVVRPDIENPLRERFSVLTPQVEVCTVRQREDDLPPDALPPADPRAKPWGTGHAVWTARKAVRGPFAVINADDFYGPTAYRRIAQFFADHPAPVEPAEFAMVAFRLDRTLSRHGSVSRGICRISQTGGLERVREVTGLHPGEDGGAAAETPDGSSEFFHGTEPVSMNFWGFTPQIFPMLERELAEFTHRHREHPRAEFYLPSAVDRAQRTGTCRVTVLHSPDSWLGMTYRQDRPRVQAGIAERIRQGVYPAGPLAESPPPEAPD